MLGTAGYFSLPGTPGPPAHLRLPVLLALLVSLVLGLLGTLCGLTLPVVLANIEGRLQAWFNRGHREAKFWFFEAAIIVVPAIIVGLTVSLPRATSSPVCETADVRDYPAASELMGRQIRLESVNYPGYFMSFGQDEVLLERLDVGDEGRATFTVERGLADSDMVSFRFIGDTRQADLYLRHRDFFLEVEQRDETSQYEEDATFGLHPGLGDPHGISFHAYQDTNSYIRHVESVFYVTNRLKFPASSDAIFRDDATFCIHFADQ
ncbi:AbfB domain-containing protein [Geodermatophilus saharensis]|uniref:AbfB domain-containing protein n=1 Tax=Geodermatophilus saharensis TaxID=1137994 RepID=UPI001140241E|nr:AbfB domain-containing protein [Geodermatophilus saharensis]